jgi:hypothetical protein
MVGDAMVAMTWHRRLGHISKQGLNILLDRNSHSSLKSVDL